jgi:ribosomal protein S18 acetylase RimI-like enzyme
MAFDDNLPVSTGMLFRTGSVIGVHLIGVSPSFRDRGIARKMMNFLLAECSVSGCQHVTLQASIMGEALYRGLGFVDQFEIINYTFSHDS